MALVLDEDPLVLFWVKECRKVNGDETFLSIQVLSLNSKRFSYTYTHIHSHTYTHIHTYTHTYTHTHMHTYTHTHIHTCTESTPISLGSTSPDSERI
jgi:hypothetical protein